ncbi:MAG: DUF4919 domain-containing protein [Cytophagaceae bacterium]
MHLRIVSLIAFIVISIGVHAQNYDSIKTVIQTKGGYPTLVNRFVNADSTFSKDDFYLLYYGFPTTTAYQPEEIAFQEALLKPYSVAGKPQEVIALADSIIKIDPVSITAYFEYAYALNTLQRSSEAAYYFSRYQLFCRIITLSGKGSASRPYLVNTANDAIEFLSYLNLRAFEDQSLGDGLIEFKLVKNKRKLKSVYFKMPVAGYTIDE